MLIGPHDNLGDSAQSPPSDLRWTLAPTGYKMGTYLFFVESAWSENEKRETL
jgi:hypothetical protein